MPKGSKVLIADDDNMLIDMYQERLRLAGYDVTPCSNGEEALQKIHEVSPDIILLDIMMPKLNGYEVLSSLRSDPQTKDIPVVMLTALIRDFNREKAIANGADDYLIKSEAMPQDVIKKVEEVLSKRGKGNSVGATGAIIVTNQALPTVPTPPQEVMQPEANNEPLVPVEPPKVQQEDKTIEQPLANVLPKKPKEKSPISLAIIVFITILITSLINDLIIYFLFIKK